MITMIVMIVMMMTRTPADVPLLAVLGVDVSDHHHRFQVTMVFYITWYVRAARLMVSCRPSPQSPRVYLTDGVSAVAR
ncbi:hypothetical protein BV898_01661 [Hypsibius exemplaris]|uniref:Secreted protein n=1 Tax=Hypsibius exemplaris TaxID=2072580 RepID=A0A1W0XBD7_HYPEX|nr:hypothetical protein BV898_01661 [Hypsibius exemplaris]